MKNKRFLIIAILAIIIIAIIIGFNVTNKKVGDFLFSTDGTVVDGHKDLINHLKNIEDTEERKKEIDYSLSQNIITQEEANNLY